MIFNKRKLAEEKVVEAEQRYRTLVDHMSEGLLQVDNSDVIIFANHRFCEMTGYSLEELVGNVGANIFLDESEREIIINKGKLRLKGVVDIYVIKIRCKNNEYKWVQVGGSPVTNIKGTTVGSIGVFTDITDRLFFEKELRESEKKYRDLFEKSDDAVLIINNGKFVDCNIATVKMLRYNDKKELLETHPSELSPEFQPDGRASLEKADEMMQVALEKGSHRFEWNHKKSDGEIFPVEVLLTAINTDNNNKILYTVWRDITKRKKAELQLAKYAEELKALNELKDKFFSIISHDLRGPFQGFLGATSFLISEIDNLTKEEIVEIGEALNTSLKKQFDLLNTLLDWSRVQTGDFYTKFEDIKLKNTVDEVMQPLDMLAAQKEIGIINLIDDYISVYADKNTLSLVIRNLISNGIKFTNKKGTIKISAVQKGRFVEITVEDNGVGIPSNAINKLFRMDLYYSTEGTSNESGSGLGLLLCKEIINKFGGNIWVESELNIGSKFIFTIPISELKL
ncbi:MAG: PAS domain-containing sensor histidine kinase [Ignavibacteriaceae bacterium]|nr:PAS domain-containing sensor histidine kinase [Ignavibacteriaceae bacterium]